MNFLRQMMSLWEEFSSIQATARRKLVLNPNHNSKCKVERYSLGLHTDIDLGTSGPFAMMDSPDVMFRPQEVCINASTPGMFLIQSILVGNVNVLIGGQEDAYNWRNKRRVDWPTLSPANKIVITGSYTGKIPADNARTQLERLESHHRQVDTFLRTVIADAYAQPTIKKVRKALEVAMHNGVAPYPVNRETFQLSVSLTGPAVIAW